MTANEPHADPTEPKTPEQPEQAEPQDITRASLIERLAPNWAGPYIRLARLDRPIGTWLLLFPCWWSMVLALPYATIPSEMTPIWYATLFAIGAVIMRGAGCTINDILDRDLDAQVVRTRTRPLPAGEVSVKQALAFVVIQALIGFAVLVQFSVQTITIGVMSLALVVTYPLMKRITFWPQLFLGLTFNWGALVGWVAMTGNLSWPTLLLYAGGVFWTLGYDTIYAYQDRADDLEVGVKSSAIRLGDAAPFWIGFSYLITWGCWATAIYWASGSDLVSVLYIAPVALHFIWQISSWQVANTASSLAIFKSNRWVGWLMLIGVAASIAPA